MQISDVWFQVIACLGALGVSAALTPVVALAARTFGIVDLPNSRNVTRRPTPRVGGIAIAVACALAASVVLLTGGIRGGHLSSAHLLMMLAAGGSIVLLGLLDDIVSVPSKIKLLALIAAGAAVCGVGIRIDSIRVHGEVLVTFGHLTWLVTILWIAAITVSINFIDGLDGLAGGISLIAAGVIAVVAALTGAHAVAVLTLALAGGLAGFLIYNVYPARIFMGDCGSMFVGFMLGTLSVALQREWGVGSVKGLALPAIALAIPLIDTSLTIVRRSVIDRRSLFRAERGHIHHRLMDQQGLRHPQAVVVLWGVSLLTSLLGAAALLNKGWATVAGLLLIVPLLAGLFRIAGSVRLRHTLAAIRRNRYANAVRRSNQASFDEMQNRFRIARDFESWWKTLCDAAAEMRCVSIDLTLTRRDGTTMPMQWRHDELAAAHAGDDADAIHATVPIPQRRVGSPVRAEVVVSAADGLEMAGQRLAMLSRLLAEHGLDTLSSEGRNRMPTQPRLRLVGMNGAIDLPTSTGTADASSARRAAIDSNRLSQLWELPSRDKPRVALVHDFLYTYAGAEKVLEQFVNVYPDAEIFSLFDFLPDDKREFIRGKRARTSFIQRLPFASTKHRAYLPLMPLAIEQLDLSGFDIVVSSSYLAAKGVITKPSQLHVCYCHSPARYAWDLQGQYLQTSNMAAGVKSFVARSILHYLRMWDVRSANGVDHFLTNSDFVGRRVEKIYRRKSRTIYPPVDVDGFEPNLGGREDYYLAASRLVPYKRMDLIVEAFKRMPDKRLVIVGDGPEFERLKAMAPANVRLVGHVPLADLKRYMQLAKGFIFAAEEDFGIVLVEAHACGTPVIAFGRGGAREIVLENETGLFFHHQRPEDIVEAVQAFEQKEWDAARIRAHAEGFAATRFCNEVREFVDGHWQEFADRLGLEATLGEPLPDGDDREQTTASA